jgi:proteasome lid subunit RPN8/RPN11
MDDHHEHLKKIAEEIEEDVKEESRLMKLFKKTYIIVITLIIVTLLLANTNLGYHMVTLLSGKIISSTMNPDFTFDLKYGGEVKISEPMMLRLQQLFRENQKTEFKACLLGKKEGDDYVVDDIYVPLIYKQEVYSVTSEMCSEGTIISLHSHPPMRCIFSEQDITSFNQFRQERNKDGIIALMCGEDRMSFFGYENV